MAKCPDCKHPTPTVEGELKCLWHINKDKKAVKKPIAKESAKRKVQNADYNKNNKEFANQHKICEGLKFIAITGVKCLGLSNTTQHLKGRIGELLTDQRYQIRLCWPCRDWVNHNAKKAKELGLELSRHAKNN